MFTTPKQKYSVYDNNVTTVADYNNPSIAKVLFDSANKSGSGNPQYASQSISIVFPVIRENDLKDVSSRDLLNYIMSALET